MMGDGRWGCLVLGHFLRASWHCRGIGSIDGCGDLPGEDSAGLTMSGIQQSKGSRKNVLEARAKAPRQKCSSTGKFLGFSN